MRILYVQPGRGIGGSKISLYHLLRDASSGQVSHVALTTPYEPEYHQMISDHVEKIHYMYLPSWQKRKLSDLRKWALSNLFRFRRGWYLFPIIRLVSIIHREHIDLVHTNNSICPIGAFAACVTRKPHVWHIREPIGKDGLYPLTPGDKITAHLFPRLSKVIICNSQYTATFFQSRGIEVQVIYNGIETAKFNEAASRKGNLRQKLGLRVDDLVIGIVASIRTEWKEHDIFLRAAAELLKSLPQCRFVVFGSSSDLQATPYTRYLAKLAEKLKVNKQLIWADYIDDVPAIMHSMDIMVHPTSMEGSGRVVMEAMAAGTPVVAVRSGGVQELVQDGKTGYLVQPNEPTALAEATQRLLDNHDLRSEMGKRAKVYAKEHFSHENTAATIQNLYQSILST